MRRFTVLIKNQRSNCDVVEIQEWIGQIGFTATRFDYELADTGELLSVSIDFLSPEEADIVCDQFGGEILTQQRQNRVVPFVAHNG